MTAYYNEIDDYAARWLRNLILEGVIAPGHVDTRSIEDVTPNDLVGFTQCHFFAGIGVWSYALRLAGWPDDSPVWTGSCPCQPFSAAGKGRGFADQRHLWPHWFHLIELCRPPVVFGEQVASPDGLAWLDIVSADVEAAQYALGAIDTCAAGFGAPHIRQRLYFVAESDSSGQREGSEGCTSVGHRQAVESDRGTSQLADADGRDTSAERLQRGWKQRQQPQDGGALQLGDAHDSRPQGRSERRDGASERIAGPSSVAGFWADAEWIPCRDGKWRPVEPGSFPLVAGAPARVGRLRAYGNAIVAPLAEEFIRAYRDLM